MATESRKVLTEVKSLHVLSGCDPKTARKAMTLLRHRDPKLAVQVEKELRDHHTCSLTAIEILDALAKLELQGRRWSSILPLCQLKPTKTTTSN